MHRNLKFLDFMLNIAILPKALINYIQKYMIHDEKVIGFDYNWHGQHIYNIFCPSRLQAAISLWRVGPSHFNKWTNQKRKCWISDENSSKRTSLLLSRYLDRKYDMRSIPNPDVPAIILIIGITDSIAWLIFCISLFVFFCASSTLLLPSYTAFWRSIKITKRLFIRRWFNALKFTVEASLLDRLYFVPRNWLHKSGM